MLSMIPLALAFTLPPMAARVAPTRSGIVRMASWADIGSGASTRASSLATLNELAASGESSLFNSMKLAPRAVSLRELSQTSA